MQETEMFKLTIAEHEWLELQVNGEIYYVQGPADLRAAVFTVEVDLTDRVRRGQWRVVAERALDQAASELERAYS